MVNLPGRCNNSKFDASNNRASKYIKQKWMQPARKMHKFSIMVGIFYTFLSVFFLIEQANNIIKYLKYLKMW